MNGGDGEYRPSLKNRHIQMIAFGGAIGVGLFLGSAARLQAAGPGLVLAYAVCGFAVFFVMRALGELVLHRPTAGSFVEYAREFVSPGAAFTAGWMYWLNWAMTGIAEITAAGLYVQYWLPGMPQWLTALIALALVLGINLISVRLFGEMEFWFAMLKVFAIVLFLLVGIALVAVGAGVGPTYHAGVGNLWEHGGFFPKGFGVVLMSLQAVVFAYAACEMVGITAGETANPRKVLPRAINEVIWRIAIFYVGSILLLVMVLPWTAYHSGESPFVTVFAALGVPGAGGFMNLVVLTAALSSCNSGLYSTGRILRSMAAHGEAPRFVGTMNKHHAPQGGILFTGLVYFAGIVLNVVVPSKAFDIATSIASLGVLTTWATLLWCQLRLRAKAERGELERPSFRMPGSPYTNYGTLAFLALIVVLMGLDRDQRVAVYAIPVIVVVLWLGWRAVSSRRSAV
ncbi:amino acid permease [Actinocorallia lasiicapitis]